MRTCHRPETLAFLRLFSLFAYLFAFAFAVTPLAAEIESNQTHQQFTAGDDNKNTIDYLLSLPSGYNQSKARWPLLLFLHGAGERGNNIRQVAKHGPPKQASQNKRGYGAFIVVSPQCPRGSQWSDKKQLELLGKLIDHIKAHYRVDPDRVYLTGLSMGGYGTWHLAAAMPGRFAAIAPICGGGNPDHAARIAGIPVWAFHGAKDRVVPVSQSQQMVDAVKARGGNVQFTVYPDAGHDSWTATYDNPALARWLLTHSRN